MLKFSMIPIFFINYENMNRNFNRRNFVKTAALGGIGLGLTENMTSVFGKSKMAAGGKIGIIGLDTSHAPAFAKAINSGTNAQYAGFKIVAAYPKGSNDIKSSIERVAGYTETVKSLGVEIVNSIEELVEMVDFVLLETNDGNVHLEQALPVLKAGKRLFIDKPVASSLADSIAIFDAAKHYNVPMFSASSLRYITGTEDIANGKIGKVLGADTFSPCSLEPSHTDFSWYGIHGVEILFTVMGTGIKTVSRVHTADTDNAVGTWNDGRIGSFRGLRKGRSGYGGNVFGEKGILALGNFSGYDALLVKILEFFNTGIPPVKPEETLDIMAFIQAADESKRKGGVPVEIAKIVEKASKQAKKIRFA